MIRLRSFAAPATILALFSLHADSLTTRPSTDLINPQRFTIEIWQENIFAGLAAHTFLVTVDRRTNARMYYEGLATNRKTGRDEPLGFAETCNIYIFGDMKLRSKNSRRIAILYQTNDPIEAAEKIATITAATYIITTNRHPYSLFTRSSFGRNYYKVNRYSEPILTYNSNSVTRTLVDVGEFDKSKIKFTSFVPGWNDPIPLPASYRVAAAEIRLKAKTDPSVFVTSMSSMTRTNARFPNSDAPTNSIKFLVKADSVFRPKPKPVLVAAQTAKP